MASYKSTILSCYIGYFTQAIVNNLAPVFFVIFQQDYNISLTQISFLIFINFGVQIITDILSVYTVDKFGCRNSIVLAHIVSTIGLVLLGVLPKILPSPYVGMIIAIVFYAYGSGLIEVMVSPVVDAIPSESKSSAMSLLHSFYCWGQLAVVLFSTLALKLLGGQNWFILPIIWAIIPFVNIFNFLRVPFAPMVSKEEKTPLRELLSSKTFCLFLLMMLCSGATEMTIAQWSSLFAEKGLGVSKVVGDLLGPGLFALFMGSGRVLYGFLGNKINLRLTLIGSAVLGIICYLLTSLSPSPAIALIGCALLGLGSSILWPGCFSLASRCFPKGGTTLFGLLAFFGDLGCTFGPYIAGIVADLVKTYTNLGNVLGVGPEQAGLKAGIFVSVIFPLVLLVSIKKINPSKIES